MLRFLTAGESHGQALVVTVDGVPAGLSIDIDALNAQLRRRQGGYGRGRRMQIESDRAEVLSGVRLHVMQYALVGSALAVFFLLLLALSEHVAFAHAYASAAVACVALLTFYLRHPLGTRRRVAAFFGLFASMYGALYVLLRSEDHAMLMGSLLVFALLAVTMVATRSLDWSAVSGRLATR